MEGTRTDCGGELKRVRDGVYSVPTVSTFPPCDDLVLAKRHFRIW